MNTESDQKEMMSGSGRTVADHIRIFDTTSRDGERACVAAALRARAIVSCIEPQTPLASHIAVANPYSPEELS